MAYKDAEFRKAYMRAWHKKRRAERTAYERKWRTTNATHVARTREVWSANNVEKRKDYSMRSNHKRTKLPKPKHPRTAACECCGRPEGKRRLALDHCHKTGEFRGWLCLGCNTAIGRLGDDVTSLQGVVRYLRRRKPLLPTGSVERKAMPIATGVFDYFPSALGAIAEVSYRGNEKHNPGQPLHHARGKSMDHADCIQRHFAERGSVDAEDGLRHSAKLAWRALALLQEELEAAGAPLARGARIATLEEK